jgi:hypothetical protein
MRPIPDSLLPARVAPCRRVAIPSRVAIHSRLARSLRVCSLLFALALGPLGSLPVRAEEPEAEPVPKPPPESGKKKTPRLSGSTILLAVGDAQRLDLPGGTQIICDDPEVASGDVEGDAVVIKGHKRGTTSCGARLAGTSKGLWKVTVIEAEK